MSERYVTRLAGQPVPLHPGEYVAWSTLLSDNVTHWLVIRRRPTLWERVKGVFRRDR